MKTENTPENKAKFFALYWGQMVLSDGMEIGGCVGDCEEYMFLQLKPLSAISDEDAIEVAKIAHPLTFTYNAKWEIVRDNEYEFVTVKSKGSHHSFDLSTTDGTLDMYQDNHKSDNSVNHYGVLDFLRSKGYLIGWMDLTPEDILAYGWARLEGEG